MRVVVLVPRRADHAHRDRVWSYVWTQLQEFGWPVYEGHHTGGLFCRSAAINRAAEMAGDWDAAVISDADVLAPGWDAAVKMAMETGAVTMPHTDYRYLSEDGTRSILAGEGEPCDELVEWSEPNLCIAQCVVTRELWERVGGFDERFVGHSFQDVAFYYACRALAGEARIEGPLWHLWHPIDTTTPPENQPMAAEYLAAFQQGRMEAFLEELKCLPR